MSEHPRSATRGVRLTREQAWAVTAASHTGVFTTLRRDGTPISIPIWFVVLDGYIYLSTPARSKKAARVRHNPRCSFLVESGTRWAELRAVHFTGTAHVVPEDDDASIAARKALTEKYEPFRTKRDDMPTGTAQHYEQRGERVLIRLTPDDRILSWDNTALGVP